MATPWSAGITSPPAPWSGGASTAMQPWSMGLGQERQRGFFGSLLHETGQDIIGTGKVLGAAVLAPLDVLGVTVPITFDDVTKRDWTGALMTASIAVGGLASKGIQTSVRGARGAAEFQRSLTAVQRAGITAGAEAGAGAFFGGLKPLEAEEGRLESIMSNTALFGAFGGGFSMLGSGIKATVGVRLAELKGQTKQALLAEAARAEHTRISLQEFAGIRLRNPDAKTEKIIRRQADGSVVSRYLGAEDAAEEVFGDYNAALAAAFDTGFVENMGVPRASGALKAKSGMDPEIVKMVQGEAGPDARLSPKRISQALGDIDLSGYQAVRDIAAKSVEQERLLTWLGVESVTEATGELGEVVLDAATRRNILAALPKDTARKLSKIKKDAEFLQQAMMEGVVSMENIEGAMQARSMLKELFLNEQTAGPMTIVAAAPYDITFLSKVLTPATIARIHPEVMPFYQLADKAAETQVLGMRRGQEWFRGLERTVGMEKMNRVVAILDDVQDADSVMEATSIARAAAASTNDPGIVKAMQDVTSKLGEYRLRMIAKGRLGHVASDEIDDAVEQQARDAIDEVLTQASGNADEAERLLRQRFPAASKPNRFSRIAPASGGAGRITLMVSKNTRPGEKPWRVTEVAENAFSDMKGTYQPGQPLGHLQFDTEEAALKHVRGLRGVEPVVEEAAGNPLANAISELLDDAGRAGYFPILNIGQYRLDLDGSFHGYYRTREDALQAAVEKGGDHRAFITPSSQYIDSGTARFVSGKEFGKLTQALRKAESYEISTKEAANLLRESGTHPSAGRRKFSRFLQPRRIGIRDFSEDPFKALQFYMANAERTLAFDTFERQAQALIDNVPDSKKALKQWMRDQTHLMLGRPTQYEELMQNALERMFPGAVEPRALRRWALFMRRAQGWSKLGGLWSGAVNLTQIAVNLAPMIGTRWAGEGMRAAFTKKGRAQISALVEEAGIDLGLHTGMLQEGTVAGTETIRDEVMQALAVGKLGNKKAAMRHYGEALENLWMASFTGAERINRLASFYGAYQKALKQDRMAKPAAIAYAKEVVDRTQFNYRVSNIPQIMQGPIGGLIGQFKTFFINEMELLAQVDTKTRLKMLFAMQALGGLGAVASLPGADLINNASRLFFDMKLTEAFAIGTDKAESKDDLNLTKLAAFGVPGFFGLDTGNYVGPGGFAELTRGWMGPTGSDARAAIQFAMQSMNDLDASDRVSPSTVNAFLQRALPAQVRRLMRGLDIIDSGEVRNPYSGKLVYKPDNRLASGALQALGPPDLTTSINRAMDDYTDRKVRHYREARESFRKQIALAMIQGNKGEAAALQQEAQLQGIQFTPAQVRDAVESFSKTATERRRDRTPRDLRDELAPFLR